MLTSTLDDAWELIRYGEVDWDALAVIISAVAIGVAVLAPLWHRRRERAEGTHEILSATAEAFDLFEDASAVPTFKGLRAIVARADHLRLALERLVQRPELSDGAVVTGCGGIRILQAVSDFLQQVEDPAQQAEMGLLGSRLEDVEPAVMPAVAIRAGRLIHYARKRRWAKWKRLQKAPEFERFRRAYVDSLAEKAEL